MSRLRPSPTCPPTHPDLVLELHSGDVVWADLGDSSGREYAGRRPLVVIAGEEYLEIVDTLAIVVPVTTRDRGWSNHVRLAGPAGLDAPSFAVTEQPLKVSRARLLAVAGRVDDACLGEIRGWVRDFVGAH